MTKKDNRPYWEIVTEKVLAEQRYEEWRNQRNSEHGHKLGAIVHTLRKISAAFDPKNTNYGYHSMEELDSLVEEMNGHIEWADRAGIL